MKIFLPAPKGSGNSNPGPGSKGYSSANFVGEAKTAEEKLHRAAIREAEMRQKFNIVD